MARDGTIGRLKQRDAELEAAAALPREETQRLQRFLKLHTPHPESVRDLLERLYAYGLEISGEGPEEKADVRAARRRRLDLAATALVRQVRSRTPDADPERVGACSPGALQRDLRDLQTMFGQTETP